MLQGILEWAMKLVIVSLMLLLIASAAWSQDTITPPATLQRITGSGDQSITTPIPDPTKLTTEAVDRLKEQLTTQFNQQIDSINKELERMQKEIDSRPVSVLVDEKFKGVDDQFIARDNNLATALTAQKDDAAKTERNFTTQIGNTQKVIDDLKDRVTRAESASVGAGGAINWVIAAVGFVSVMIGIVIALFSLFKPQAAMPVVTLTPESIVTPRRK